MKKFFKNESGANAIGYALIAAAIALALIAVMPKLADASLSLFGITPR